LPKLLTLALVTDKSKTSFKSL